MQCPKCGLETRIELVYTSVEGDESPDTATKVYTVQEHRCVNPQCVSQGKTVASQKHLVYDQSRKGGEAG